MDQLSLFPSCTVELTWHPALSPPDAEGPFDHTFQAQLFGVPEYSGWGRTESTAVSSLGDVVSAHAALLPVADQLTAFGHACAAARQLDRQHLVRWLCERADRVPLAGHGV